MNVLYYALPCFLGHGEAFKYAVTHLNLLTNFNKIPNFNPIFIKEMDFPLDTLKNYTKNTSNIHSIDSPLDNTSELKNIISKNDITLHHCLHNGFSLSKEYNIKSISTIYTTLPLNHFGCLDSFYSKMYLDKISNSFNCSNRIIVPYNFMKKELCNFFSTVGNNIDIIPPNMPSNLIGKSKPLSKAYVKTKFNLLEEYYIYIGELNPRNNLIDTIKLFKYYSSNLNIKLVLSLTFLNKNKDLYFELLSFIDRLGLTSKVIFINDLSYTDFINLINASSCFINLNPFNELNITNLYALLLNTKILTYQTYSNLEFLENYPIYISNYTDGLNLDLSKNKFITNHQFYSIVNKFNSNIVSNKLFNTYASTIK